MSKLYYRISDPSDIRAIENQIEIWKQENNPKAGLWELLPEKPTESSIWQNGNWIVPPPPQYTANEWLENQGFNSVVLVTLLDLENKLKDADKVSSKLVAVRGWINSILAQYIQDPEPKSDWTETPYQPQETISDAFQKLWM